MSDPTKLQLYITGGTPNSDLALANLRHVLKRFPELDAGLEIIDLRAEPMRALQDGVVAVPTLQMTCGIRRTRWIGDLSQTQSLESYFAGRAAINGPEK